MKRQILILFLIMSSASLFPVSLVEMSNVLRMEQPFTLESGKENAGYYLNALRMKEEGKTGKAFLPAVEVTSGKELFVWVRVWWESIGENSFTLGSGPENTLVFSGKGFSEDWQWVKGNKTFRFSKDTALLQLIYGKGAFNVDTVILTEDSDFVPRGDVQLKGSASVPVYFTDDFMRENKNTWSNLGDWVIASGKWQQYMISDVKKGHKSSNPERSANGFALRGDSGNNEPAIILNGKDSWRNYQVTCSLKMTDDGEAGLIINYQDKGNYYLFSGIAGTGAKLRLVRFLHGEQHLIAENPIGLEQDIYYSLSAETVNGRLICTLDDTEIFNLRDSSLLSGRIGLFSQNKSFSVFDDVFARSAGIVAEDFENWEYGYWKKIDGEWWVKWPHGSAGLLASLGEPLSPGEQNRTSALIGRNSGTGRIVMGEHTWSAYEGSVDVSGLDSGEGAGILFSWVDPDNYWMFTAKPEKDRKTLELDIYQIKEGKRERKERVKAEMPDAPLSLGVNAGRGKGVCYINSRKILQIIDHTITGGKFGLVSSGGETEFDNVVVELEKKKKPESWSFVVPVFEGENSMRNWARESSDWVAETGSIFRNIKDLYGDLTVEIIMHKCDRVYSLFLKNSINKVEGYRLDFEQKNEDSFAFRLYRKEQPVASRTVKYTTAKEDWEDGLRFGFEKEGHYLSALINGEPVLEYRDIDPIEDGRRIAVALPGYDKVENVNIISEYLKNYLFTTSPVDWYSRGGEWKITNRWKCDPRWSWYGGRSDQKAVLWNKREIEGDFTIDLFMSMQMDVQSQPHYYHPGNMNITVCADGENIGSGYSFIFGGDLGRATRIVKNGETVAETTEKKFRPPSTRDAWQPMEGPGGLHRRWFHLTVVRRGNLFEYYLDNTKMLTYRDEKPLSGKRFCIWTYDNGIMLARARVTAEGISERRLLDAPVPLPVIPDREENITIDISSQTHPYGFDTPVSREGWMCEMNTIEGKGKSYSALVDSAHYKEKECLRVSNRESGGKFSLLLYKGSVKPSKMQQLTFDYAITPETKIHLLFRTNFGWYYTAFTGEEPVFRPATPAFYPQKLGSLKPVTDGDWHSATVDIYTMFKTFLDTKSFESVEILGVYFAQGNYGYLDAGLGGNFKRSSYYLDNVYFETPGREIFKASWKDQMDSFKKVSFVLDRKPSTVPDPEKAVETSSFESGTLEPGIHYFHITGFDEKGEASATLNYRINVDDAPPAIQLFRLTPQQAEVVIEDDCAGVNWDSLNVMVHNRKLTTDPKYCTVFAGEHKAVFSFEKAGVILEPGTIRASVVSVEDRAGNVLRESETASLKFLNTDDTVAPVTEFVLPPYLEEGKFRFTETDDLWDSQVGNTVTVLKDRNECYSAPSSMMVIHNGYGSTFRIQRDGKTFNAGEYPLITFRYRLTPDVRVNPVFRTAAGTVNIKFADNNSNAYTVGDIGGVNREQTWSQAEVNLRKLLLNKYDTIKNLDIFGMSFEDIEWKSADTLTRYWIDDFMLHKFYDNSKGEMMIGITAGDSSGVDYIAYRFNNWHNPGKEIDWNEVKPQESAGIAYTSVSIPSTIQGIKAIEMYAADRSGNKSEVKRFPLLLDNTNPAISDIHPLPQSETAISEISVKLKDVYSGIKRKSVKLKVNGKEYGLRNAELTYSEKTGVLNFDLSRKYSKNVFPDQKEVKVGLYAEDGIGHPIKNVWYWKMDYSKDTTPPPAPFVTRLPSLSDCEMFETGTGLWQPRSGWRGAKLSVTTFDPATGKRCLSLKNGAWNSTFDCFIRKRAFDPALTPMVSFDYKMTADIQMDFLVQISGKWYAITFAGLQNMYESIGTVTCVRNGKWQHAEFDLGEMIEKKFPGKTGIKVQNFILGEYNRNYNNKPGAEMFIDNFALYSPKDAHPLRFAWKKVYDSTGIQTYKYSLSMDKNMTPVTSCGNKTLCELDSVVSGKYYFMLTATDNNNNVSKKSVLGPITVK